MNFWQNTKKQFLKYWKNFSLFAFVVLVFLVITYWNQIKGFFSDSTVAIPSVSVKDSNLTNSPIITGGNNNSIVYQSTTTVDVAKTEPFTYVWEDSVKSVLVQGGVYETNFQIAVGTYLVKNFKISRNDQLHFTSCEIVGSSTSSSLGIIPGIYNGPMTTANFSCYGDRVVTPHTIDASFE